MPFACRVLVHAVILLCILTMAKCIAVVTGSNQGIGREIARNLARDQHVILACRNPSAGVQACSEMTSEGLDVEFMRLDIADKTSIQNFASTVANKYPEGIDTLVNNAATAFKGSDPTPFSDQADPTFKTNLFGTIDLTEALLPLLKKSPRGAKIVNVASMAGHLKILAASPDKQKQFVEASSTAEVKALAQSFIEAVKDGTHAAKGWPNTCYGMSKLALISYTNMLSRREPSIQVNSCCPGYVATSMSSGRGTKTPAQGAVTPTMLAMLADKSVTGQFWSEGRSKDW